MKLSVVIPIVAAVLLFPHLLTAQESGEMTEVNIYSGLSFPGADLETLPCFLCLEPRNDALSPLPGFTTTTSLGHSVQLGFKVGRYLNSNMEIEGNFAVGPDHTLTVSSDFECPPGQICPLFGERRALFPLFFSEENAVSYNYDANFLYNFTTSKVRPYVTVGVGGTTVDAQSDARTDFTFNYGAGAKFYFNRLGVRFEVNDHVIPDHWLSGNTEHDVQVQYGVLFGM